MAEVVGIVASTLTLASSAALLSRALFDVVETLKHARKEIASIAQHLSNLSGSLNLLADLIKVQQSLCRPALFKNTKAIIRQYGRLEIELKKLLESPQSMARLSWYIKKNRAKSLLKEIEAIKSSLTLEVSIIQLAREEIIRPRLPENAPTKTISPQPNRFRKLVESVVQANRQVVESAQRDDAQRASTKNVQSRAELDVYNPASCDTATWLYDLVFGNRVPASHTQNTPTTHPSDQAYVLDREDQEVVGIVPLSETSDASEPTHQAMIVWNHSTEPAIVVNRLLASWTTLTDEQIELSSTRQSEDVWYESVIKMAEEIKEDYSESSEMYEEACKSESSNYDINIRAGQSGTRDDKEGRVKKPYDNTRTNHRRPRHALEPDYMLQNKASISGCSGRSAPRARSWHSDSEADIPGAARHSDTWDPSETELRDQDSFARTLPASNVPAPQYRQASMHGQSMGHNPFNTWSQPTTQGNLNAPPSNSNPFTPILPSSKHNQHQKRPKVVINMQETVDSSNLDHSSDSGHSPLATDLASLAGSHPRRRSNHPRMPPINIYMPNTKNLPPLSSSPHINQTQERSAHSESNTKGSKPAVADPRFGRILELLTNQQEQNAQYELDRARVTAELEMRHMLAAREKDFADIGRLEKLIMQQQDDQQRANAAWRAERAVLDEQAAKQVQEAKELVEREISAARAAKKAAQKALKFAKADAEKRAKEEIEDNARKEKEKADKKLKDRIASYEKLLDTAIMERSTPLIYNGLPICTANGKRCHDATVSSEDMEVLEPSSRLSAASANFPEEMHSQRTNKRSGDVQPIVPPSFKGRHNMSCTTVQAVQASQMRSQSGTPVQPHQQIILLPSNLNRASAKISELQTSLAEFGVVTKFHGSDLESVNETLELQSPMARGVRSSIFWEPPSSGMGSELLETLRRFGWRPPYARSSASGHTYFLGSQPVHAYFFRPDYKPQFSPCKTSSNSGKVIIDKGLVHEYALIESGLAFESTDAGTYHLDGRLQYSDIEALVERSFSMRETHHRSAHRQLEWYSNSAIAHLDTRDASDRSGSPMPKLEVPVTERANPYTPSSPNREHDASPRQMAGGDEDLVHTFRLLDTDDEKAPSLSEDNTFGKSPSVASLSCKSNNPFRMRMEKLEAQEVRYGSSTGLSDNIWTDQILI